MSQVFTDDSLVDFMEDLLFKKERKQKEPILYPLQGVFESIGSSEYVRYLPRWSDNVGDRVFSRIRNDLHFRQETGSDCFEYLIYQNSIASIIKIGGNTTGYNIR